MSVLRTWALRRVRVIGLPFLIDKVMRLLDRALLCSFHSTEWGLLSARTVRYFFLSFEHSSALFPPRCIQGPSKLAGILCIAKGMCVKIIRYASNVFVYTTIVESEGRD